MDFLYLLPVILVCCVSPPLKKLFNCRNHRNIILLVFFSFLSSVALELFPQFFKFLEIILDIILNTVIITHSPVLLMSGIIISDISLRTINPNFLALYFLFSQSRLMTFQSLLSLLNILQTSLNTDFSGSHLVIHNETSLILTFQVLHWTLVYILIILLMFQKVKCF